MSTSPAAAPYPRQSELKAKELERAFEGAKRLLQKCMSLACGDVLALFWDQTTTECGNLLIRAAKELGIDVNRRYVPVEDQIRYGHNLPSEDRVALNDAAAVITCITSDPRCTPYRRELLSVGTGFENFFGHMPGATLKVLAHATEVDYEAVENRCDDLTLAMTLAKEVKLTTYGLEANGMPDPSRAYVLNIELKGEDRYPITSTGVIPRGTWGNIPGGEVFIVPLESRATGSFYLNGAFEDYVIPRGQGIVLDFRDGLLRDFQSDHPEAHAAFSRLLSYVRGHRGFNVLAELGIGVNTGIRELTGSALFDEKCHGTAHIAIGDSLRFGGTNGSDVHEDLISIGPSIEFDGKPILQFGESTYKSEDWRESIETPPTMELKGTELLLRNDVRIERVHGAFRVRRDVAVGRVSRYRIGTPTTNKILHKMLPWFPDTLSSVTERAALDLNLCPARTQRAIEILLRHGLLQRED